MIGLDVINASLLGKTGRNILQKDMQGQTKYSLLILLFVPVLKWGSLDQALLS